VAPSTPADAKGLLLAAIRDNNPVIYLEAKGLYGMFRPDLVEEVPEGDFEVPLGRAAVRREGKGVTVLTYGAMVHTALAAAKEVDLEVIDLRTLWPLDEGAILASVAKTHRALILHEDSRRGGVGAELAAILAEKALGDLDAPVVRVCAPDMPAPYSPPLEHAYLPKASDVVVAARRLMEG
jgi:2-oxoisovalerate dehydrogenase E1 component beta subunit